MDPEGQFSFAVNEKALFIGSSSMMSGRFQRFFAFLIDAIVLGLIGFVLNVFFRDHLVLLGRWGRGVGFLIAVVYFGIFNSEYSLGQTIGKKFAGVMVVNADGWPISLKRSFIRSLIFCIPYFLGGFAFAPGIKSSPFSILLSVATLGLGGGIVYLYLFNHRSGQSLHDILVDSYVIRASRLRKVEVDSLWMVHVIVVMLWITAVSVLGIVSLFKVYPYGVVPDLVALEEEIYNIGKMHDVSVFTGRQWREPVLLQELDRYPKLRKYKVKFYRCMDIRLAMVLGGRSLGNFLEMDHCYVTGIIKYSPGDPASEMNEMARVILESYSDAMQMKHITVSLAYGYDLGIRSSYVRHIATYTPERWQDLVYGGDTKEEGF